MEYFIGVDGGGTHCRARLQNSNNVILGEAHSGSANVMLGVETAWNSILIAAQRVLTQAKFKHTDWQNVHLGLALAGCENETRWHEFMQYSHPFGEVVLNTDAYGACLGAHDGQEGGVVISGTGSVALAIQDQKLIYIGGHEFPISDFGSGAMLGLALIQKTLLAVDGLEPTTPLSEHIMQHFNHSIEDVVIWSKSAQPKDYAKFARTVIEYEENGDLLGKEIVAQCLCHIEQLIRSLVNRGVDKVSILGGLGQRLEERISQQFSHILVPAKKDALDGALIMARNSQHNLFGE
ncbi:BadF/BadG/BcrA/BcrD ATPase family protein [Vibrio mediterranei]|uniref:BadF/BadG/BcrA/BcrD ATPase family protein n=1 Tax=Vibrio mediterranei TaxID=689 RepID=UPI00148E4ADE|nr:BadF/BadG/BcrA/BcrD ATPase family protein [Vibrio mediterranei]NOH31324.1 N-acetylglucosamine kinase [Vibrio mediterranei]